jgi:serine/threonine protein kinase
LFFFFFKLYILSRQIRIWSRGSDPLAGLSRIATILQKLLTEWYADVEYRTYVRGKTENDWISLEICEIEAAKGKKIIKFPQSGVEVSLGHVLFEMSVLDKAEVPFSEIEVMEEIGKGGAGKVYRGKWRGQEIALKSLNFDDNNLHLFREFCHEMSVMCELRHPGIVALHGVSLRGEESVEYYLMMELCEIDLYHFLHDPHRIKRILDLIIDLCGFIQTIGGHRIVPPKKWEELKLISQSVYEHVVKASNIINKDDKMMNEKAHRIEEIGQEFSTTNFIQRTLDGVFMILNSRIDNALKAAENNPIVQSYKDSILPTKTEQETLLRCAALAREAAQEAVLGSRSKVAFDQLNIAIENCRGSFRAFLKPLPFGLRCKLCYQISSGMAYLHSLIPAVLHGDLKTMNVLLRGKDLQLKLTDFGLASRVEKGRDLDRHIGQNPTYVAPEVLEKGAMSARSDVYAFGIIMWELMERKVPFASIEYQVSMGIERLKQDIITGIRPHIIQREYSKSELQYLELMKRCWHEDRMSRPSFPEICHILFQLCQDEDVSSVVDMPPPLENELGNRNQSIPIEPRGEFVQYIVAPPHITRVHAPATQFDSIEEKGIFFFFFFFFVMWFK